MPYTTADVERLVDEALAAKLRTALVHNVDAWRAKYREQVLKNEASFSGYIEQSIARLDGPDEDALPAGGRARRVTEDPAVALRRLYTAKWDDLARTGLTHTERVDFAMDYAASEIHRCDVGPLPHGGVVALEDALRAELREPRYST